MYVDILVTRYNPNDWLFEAIESIRLKHTMTGT